MESNDDFVLDSVVQTIIKRFEDRARFGKKKYGTDLDRKDLTTLQWIQHAREEAMDLILYLTKLETELKNKD